MQNESDNSRPVLKPRYYYELPCEREFMAIRHGIKCDDQGYVLPESVPLLCVKPGDKLGCKFNSNIVFSHAIDISRARELQKKGYIIEARGGIAFITPQKIID